MKTLFYIIAVICFLISCKTPTLIVADKQVSDNINLEDDTPKILTLILNFKLNESSKNDDIELGMSIISNGILKKDESDVNKEDLYQFVFFNNNNIEIKRISVDDPLRRKVEYVGDDGQLAMKDMVLEKEAVPLRINYSQELSILKILKREGGKLSLQNTIKIN